MTVPVVKNMGASVRQRLLNYAKASGRPFAEVLQYYAMERFLYRLSVSPHGGKFLLKGALLLTVWQAPITRPTMDIDLLGRTSNEIDAILHIMKEVAQLEVPNDGIVFDPASFSGAAIREDADYSGVRAVFTGRLDAARVHMQIDIRRPFGLHNYASRYKSGLGERIGDLPSNEPDAWQNRSPSTNS